MMSDEILMVNTIGRADGDWGCFCPHCSKPIFFSEDAIEDVRGSQYRHTRLISILRDERCNGWLEVSTTARFSRVLFDQGAG